MFDIGWSEMLVVGVVALIVIGPKDLPAALRQAGKWMGAVRRMAADFQGQVNQVMKDAELDELRREVSDLKSGFNSMSDPVRSAGSEVKALVEKPAALPPPSVSEKPSVPETAAATPTPAPAPKPKARRAPRKKAAPAKASSSRKPEAKA